MLQALFLSAGLSLGQTGNPLPELPAPKPIVSVVRAQAGELEQLSTGTPAKVISLYTAAPEPDPRTLPVAYPASETPASAPTRTLPVSYLPPEEPKGAAPPEVSVPGAPLAPAPPAAAAAPVAAPADRWLLMKALQGTWAGNALIGSRLNVYGWTEASYTAGSEGHGAWPMLAQSPTDNFLLNQNWLVFERTVVTSGTTEPTFGFHTAWILPGSDSRYTIARHLFNRQKGVGDLTQGNYPVDLFHAYGEAFFPTVGRGLDVKLGKNAVPYFAETEDQINNPLFSHSYIFYYGGPFTHTGLQGNLKLTDEWAVEARIVMGSDIFIGPGDEPTFVGALQWTQPGGGRNTALVSVVAGSGRFDTNHNQNNLNLIDLVYTHTFNPVLKYTLDACAGYESNNPDPVNGTGTWYGAAHYLTYTVTPRLSTTGRLELFDDPQGLRTGFKGLYSAATAGVTLKLTDPYSGSKGAVWIRPELRYDYNGDSRPYNNNHDPEHGQFSIATDLIMRW